ncbi:sce7726 family protein [Comamonas thiooxydans]|uniref:Sce7726 family protein n=1 Tax=Comamonas thiooxydans TaxID=363952 RepID=A0AA42TV98_9BURK|nr:sce7726 family protein [Comamonas thiooxydans]MDH1337501.1 sce7726 family protein [Comamonas thiooxydans]MDH1743670.1 sce7726 family protein [Comamonas thiooxydans]MDH1789980.1 sce7726 family protein [Comamonas thiooxydans]CUB01453.1 hypothetical protein Ga0061062_11453 [Comamonas thiooxydans]
MQSPEKIRQMLRSWVVNAKDPGPADVLVDELCIIDKTCRADLVHANGKLTGFEVKSEADTLTRWPHQMDAYLRVFDEVWLCCHRKHAVRALSESIPAVGILIVDEYGALAVLRPAQQNKSVNSYDLTGLLWRKELDELCKEQGLSVTRKELIKEVRHRVSNSVSVDLLKAYVLKAIKERYSVS